MKKALTGIIAALAMLAAIPNVHAADATIGRGTVNQIDAAAATVNITHEAIPALKWPAMTMDFKIADKKLLSGIKSGQTVTFALTRDAKNGYLISQIAPAK
jgi:Cu/Ag efflux protein CusF